MSYSFKSLGMTEAQVFGYDGINEEGHVTSGFACSPEEMNKRPADLSRMLSDPSYPVHFAIRWQDGPIDREAGEGLNGACVEDVLEVCARRLEAYQEGPLDCVENMKAIRLIRSAIDELLLRRTKRRIDGVEGTYEAHEEAPSEDTGAKKDPALPKWQSHKVVEAGKIGRIAEHVEGGFLLTLDLPDNWTAEVQVSQEYFNKHNPLPGGYYVRYPGDGYESWSPAKAFEEGYRLLREDPAPEQPDPVLVQLPSLNRMVQFNDGPNPHREGEDRWLAAMVCYVHSDTCVNLVVWDENGGSSARTSVEQGDDYNKWRWPPRV